MRLFLKHASSSICIFRSLKVALLIGTLHALLNHFDAMIDGTLTTTNIAQMLVTYFIPYSVATYGSAMQARHIELRRLRGAEGGGEPSEGDDEGGEGMVCVSTDVRDIPQQTSGTGVWGRFDWKLHQFSRHARDPVCVARSLRVALVIGSIIALLNHFDEIIEGTLTGTNVLQMLLTYTIPFCVATYGSAMQACYEDSREPGKGGPEPGDTT